MKAHRQVNPDDKNEKKRLYLRLIHGDDLNVKQIIGNTPLQEFKLQLRTQ